MAILAILNATKFCMPKSFYRRNLPHLQRDNKSHFLTFCTHRRWTLPEAARDITPASCLHDNGSKKEPIQARSTRAKPGRATLAWTAEGGCPYANFGLPLFFPLL